MATWPTLGEIQTQIVDNPNVNADLLQLTLDSAIEYVAVRCGLETDAASVPSKAALAVSLMVNRWHTRKDSPTGVAGVLGDQAVRVPRVDPDVELLLASIHDAWPIG